MPGQTQAAMLKLQLTFQRRVFRLSSLCLLGESVALSDFRMEKVILLSGKDNTKGIAIDGGVKKKKRQRTNDNTTTFFFGETLNAQPAT
jgi:hypothetical protein